MNKIKFYKALIAVLMLYFFSIRVFAQVVYSNKPSSTFSFTLGLTSTNLVNDTTDLKSGILFSGGFIYTFNLSEKINIGMECLYTGKGLRQDSPILKYRYYYIDIPLYFQLKLSESIRLNAGMQYSNFTNSNIQYMDSTGVKVKSYNSIKNTDFGVLFGAEINITNDLSIAARYTLSASTFFEKNKVNFGVFQFSLNYVAFRTYKQIFHKKEKTTE